MKPKASSRFPVVEEKQPWERNSHKETGAAAGAEVEVGDRDTKPETEPRGGRGKKAEQPKAGG